MMTATIKKDRGVGVASLSDLVVRVDHIAIAVKDLSAATKWYEHFGFIVLERRSTEGLHTGMHSAILQAGSVVVVLIQGTSPESQVSKFITHFGPGVQHIALEITDLEEALERVSQAGGKVDAQAQDTGIRQAFLQRDPGSGVRVELIERRGGHFTDHSVRQLFLAFEQEDLY